MKNILRTEKGFTLIEMMIVLLIISILLLIAVPAMTNSNKVVQDKSCEATVKLVQSQVAAYKMDNNDNEYPTDLTDLKDNYVDSIKCPDGDELDYDSESGKVFKPGQGPNQSGS